jgi:4-hydroxy-tetrahydrodipicolinate reductase
MKLLLIGYGRMGRLVEALAPEYGWEVAGVLDSRLNRDAEALGPGSWQDVDVAIDFSTAAAVEQNLPRLAALGRNVVVGTTGWDRSLPRLRAVAEEAGIGVLAAPNFSTGVVLFGEIVKAAGALLGPQPDFGAWLHELHHAAKRDAPSGTALALKRALEGAGYPRPIDVAATRAGSIPGTHTIGFDAPSETITLTHTVRDRGTFARGALVAATWLRGRRGWFTMHDCLGLNDGGTR